MDANKSCSNCNYYYHGVCYISKAKVEKHYLCSVWKPLNNCEECRYYDCYEKNCMILGKLPRSRRCGDFIYKSEDDNYIFL